MHSVFLGLGSNIGDRLKFISNAVSEIKNNGNIRLIKSSSVYKTEPWGEKHQNTFLNIAIEISTSYTPDELLLFIKDTEIKLGRTGRSRWAEREIDIDILFYNNLVMKKSGLEIPHPEIQNRNFVLIPLNDIAPDFVHPVLKKKISDLVSLSSDKLKCERTV